LLFFFRYENPANVDKLVAVSEKVEVVKTVMKDNINELLQNTEKLEDIEKKSELLNKQASDFSKGTKDLATKMFWKKWKMRLLIGGLITAVLILIIVPTAVSASQTSKK
jgi:ribosomal protein L14E/L6E/L27E